MKLNRKLKAAISIILCFVMVLGQSYTAFAITETDASSVDLLADTGAELKTDLRDYSIPTDQKHAYDPFARLESEEATKAYREAAVYEQGTVIFKLTENSGLFTTNTTPKTDSAELLANGIDFSSATELARRKVDDGLFSDEYEVTYSASITGEVWDAVDALAATAGVVDAQPNYLYEDTAVDVPTNITKNPNADKQWHHGKDHLNCTKHWQHMYDGGYTAGEGSIVAVIDTGVDYTHPDLTANMWVNTAEMNGTTGVDDDGNGYKDDIYGVSTVGAKTYHSGDPMDDHGHGTHVAGIIAMTANNDEGAVGLAYGTKIMAIKAGQATGYFSDTDIAEAINYAHTMGADVINMSFGGTGRSFLVEEALSDAFGDCVLVAAAGNEGIPTADAPAGFLKKADFYPAGYSFVLGVMASDKNGNLASFSNWDYYNNGGSAEYEMTAPGVDIYSTLPGGEYALWDGTSMAAPLVSAAAALIRSKYNDKGAYSSRFIMGQLASATDKTLTYVDRIDVVHIYTMLDLDASLNKLPEPNLTVKSTYLFDDPAIDPANDGDGIVDAGETIDLGVVLRNQWGMAGDVTLKVDAISSGGVANPNIEWITDTVNYGDIGTFNELGNEFVYENNALVGTGNPIRFKVKESCINDAHIRLNITVTCTNALDTEDNTLYLSDSEMYFYVQRGKTISGTLSEDTTLTPDNYWIVDNTLYIPEGITLTVEAGTQLQFWGSDASDPYAAKTIAYIQVDGEFLVKGTADAPVEMFPSIAFDGYGVDIRGGVDYSHAANPNSVTRGKSELSYVNIINPRLNFNKGDHLYIVQEDRYITYRQLSGSEIDINTGDGGHIWVNSLTDSQVVNLHCYNSNIYGRYNNVLFNGCSIPLDTNTYAGSWKRVFLNCTFVGNNSWSGTGANISQTSFLYPHITYSDIYTLNDKKYVVLDCDYGLFWGNGEDSLLRNNKFKYNAANYLAGIKGGYLAVPNTVEEEQFLYAIAKKLDKLLSIGGYKPAGNTVIEYPDGTAGSRYEGSTDAFRAINSTSSNLHLVAFYGSFIIELPSTVSDEDILSPFTFEQVLNAFNANSHLLPEGLANSVTGNAFLNSFYNTNTDAWNRLGTVEDRDHFHQATGNYFGTDDEKLIAAHILDADSYAGLADIVTEPHLTSTSPELETIYPFVTDAYITNSDGERVTSCGYEGIKLHVTFNRDMDVNSLPMVSYGPAAPYTDYVVDGEFITPRHWVGTTKVRSVIDSGMEYIRIKDAVSADDAWLTTGTDEARFAFEINGTGAEALTLQANGGENKVELSWTQDDYETLAGYNVYRSTKADSGFTKINTRLIPGTMREYTDTDVEPGVEYYYYFTVMATDLSESNPSNTAAATPLDNVKPLLTHTRVTAANFGEAIAFNAAASDNIGVEYIKLYYRAKGETYYKTVNMTNISGNDYYASISAKEVSAAGMEYYIEVSDGVSVVRDGSAQYPIQISVDSTMVIYSVSPSKVDVSSADPVTAILTGVNFSETMTLKVGDKVTDYTFISTTQVSFTLPAGNLGRADITITDGERTAALTNAVTYLDSKAEVQIITPGEAKAREAIKLPVTVTANGDIYGIDIQFKITRNLFTAIKFEKSDANSAAIVSCTTNSLGVVKLSVASANAIDISAPIGYLVLTPANLTESTSTSVQLTSAKLNAVDVNTLIDCNMVIRPNFSLGGKITYWNSNKGVEGVKVTLSNGMVTYTDANGNYLFTGITENSVVVTPDYSGNVNGAVSAQDAALVLQAVTEEGETLSDAQFIAADVDGDGQLTALDAAYILQKSVGIIEGDYPGSGSEWAFIDPVKTITLTANLTNINFSAILLGDVSGDWTSTPEEELE